MGSYANFHPHVHATVTEGVVTKDGTFLPVLEPDLDAVGELFRRLVLSALRKADRLSEPFHERLLGWSPSGFSVYGRQIAHADEPGKLELISVLVDPKVIAIQRHLDVTDQPTSVHARDPPAA